MAKFPAMPLFTDAFMGDTMHLTAAQIGAYMLMLMTAWRSPECNLTNNDVFLARICRMDKRTFAINREVLLSFWAVDNSCLYQKRQKDERNYVEQLSNKNAEASKARWLKNKESRHANALPNPCQTDAPIPIPIEVSKRIEEERRVHAPEGEISNFQKIYDYGCELYPNLATQNTSAIRKWIDSEMDIEQDIIPAIRHIHGKGVKARGWGLFTQDIADNNAKRLKPMPKGNVDGKSSRPHTAIARPSKSQRFKDALRDSTLADIAGITGSEEGFS